MSIPDTLGYLDQGINTFTRKSEIEPQIALYNRVEGIWLDQFKKNWVTGTIIKKLQYDRKQVCIVSPELHNRQYETYWKMIKETINTESKKIMLCTDYPNKAKEFFDD